MNYIWLALITGLTTGGISCFAVQGGLLATSLTEENKKRSTLLFLGAKLFTYTILGFILGFLGSSLNISPKVQGIFQIIIGLFMIATAGRLLDLHPFFRYFVIEPPKFILRLMRNQAQAKSMFTPLFLGALTVFIPCGVTQAMMLYAIGTSNPLVGASIMFAFVLGTSPVFFLIGMASQELFKKKAFNYIASAFIFIIGLISINSGLLLQGVNIFAKNQIAKTGNVVNITVTSGGYKADVNTLKLGVPVKLIIKTNNVGSCARAFTIPDLNYFKLLQTTGTEVVEFTPTKLGQMTYTCSMGMYSGKFDIVE